MKRAISSILVLVMVLVVFTACEKKEESSSKVTSEVSAVPASNGTSEASSNKDDDNSKSNVDKMYDLLKKAREEAYGMGSAAGYAKYLLNLGKLYKDNIVNPYNKSTSIEMIDRTAGPLKDDKSTWKTYAGSIIVVTISTEQLKDRNLDEVVYGCNPENKGMTMGIVFLDGFIVYEIDENGKKNNVKTYSFTDADE